MYRFRTSGFTLIEALIVISLIGIAVALSAPAFSSLIRSNRIQAAAGELQRALYFARSEAMSRGVEVTLSAPSANGWAGAVTIATANTIVLPTGETLRQYPQGLGASGVLGSASNGLTALTYRPNGTLKLSSDATLRLCAANSTATGKQFTLSVGGVVAVADYIPSSASSSGCN